MESPKIYVVISDSGYGDEHYSIIVYAGLDEDKALSIAQNGGNFPSISNQWNTLQTWQNGEMLSEVCYDK